MIHSHKFKPRLFTHLQKDSVRIRMFDFFGIFGSKKKNTKKAKYAKGRSLEQVKDRLEKYMQEEQPFLRAKYTIRNLSDDLKIPSHQLSATINRLLKMNFTGYLNESRIKYCQELIKKEGDGKLVFKRIFQKSGFRNRATFTAAFKRFTGYTPSDYTKIF